MTAARLLKASRKSSLERALRNDEVCAQVTAENVNWYQEAVLRTLPLPTRARYYLADYNVEITIGSSFTVGGVCGIITRSSLAGAVCASATAALVTQFKK